MIGDYRRQKLDEELKNEWAVVILYRPPAFLIAWLLARLNVGPSAVTCFGIVVLVSLPFIPTYLSPDDAILCVCLLGVLYGVLDCVDGTLARSLDRQSGLGNYLDFASDILYRVILYGTLGSLADRTGMPPSIGHEFGLSWFNLALVSAWMALFARLCRSYGTALFLRDVPDRTVGDSAVPHGFDHARRVAFAAISGLDHVQPLVALAFWWGGLFHGYIVWLVILSLLDVIYAQVEIARDATR